MGAAFDAYCENEDLQTRINSKNRQIREQKKLIIELAKGIVKYCNADEGWSNEDLQSMDLLTQKAEKILAKQNKKKKK